jgi:NAD(P)-dependent dehydrogenase (short-subunit alcohol dehydrogenase family)
MVLGFAGAGADVVIASRKLNACQALADAVRDTYGSRALAVACHVGHWAEIDMLVDRAYAEFGRVDVLVNNAGMSPLYSSPVEVTEALWDKVVGVNVKGPFRLTALVGARMAAGDGGSIINISSTAAIRPTADMMPYAAAKAGLDALTVAFAHAYGPTVRVNSIMPGRFATDVSAAWDAGRIAEETRSFAAGRVAQPEEIVGAALYLAGDAASFTTGAVLRVDGGAP